MIHPFGIHVAQKHDPFQLPHQIAADFRFPLPVALFCPTNQRISDIRLGYIVQLAAVVEKVFVGAQPAAEMDFQTLEIPVFLVFIVGQEKIHRVGNRALGHLEDGIFETFAV